MPLVHSSSPDRETLAAAKPLWKPSHCWRADWDAAVNFLNFIEPWVRIKSEQILVAQSWNAVRLRRGGRPDDEYRRMIDLLVRQLQWLNRKGVRAAADAEPMQQCLDTLPVPIEQIIAEMPDAR